MPTIYTAHDKKLANEVFKLQYPPNGTGPRQEFQFPPKVISNNMSGNFNEMGDGKKMPGVYPAYTYAGPNERYWSIETTYIIDGGEWTNARVKEELQKYRNYYFDLRTFIDPQTCLIYFKVYGMGGEEDGKAFMRNLSIKHSGPLITPDSNQTVTTTTNPVPSPSSGQASSQQSRFGSSKTVDKYQLTHHLRTDVTFDLVYWANFSPTDDMKQKEIAAGKLPINRFLIPRIWF